MLIGIIAMRLICCSSMSLYIQQITDLVRMTTKASSTTSLAQVIQILGNGGPEDITLHIQTNILTFSVEKQRASY